MVKVLVMLVAMLALAVPALAGHGGNGNDDPSYQLNGLALSSTGGGTSAALCGIAITSSITGAQVTVTPGQVTTITEGTSRTMALGLAGGGSIYKSFAVGSFSVTK